MHEELQNYGIDRGLFSVCVLTYNNVENLELTIRSIYQQSYCNIELLVSDDGSFSPNASIREKIESILKLYRNKFKRIYVNVNSHNIGTVKHLNLLLPEIEGEYICFLGSGDQLYRENVLENVVNFFSERKTLLCCSKRLMQITPDRQLVYPEHRIIKAIQKGNRELLKLCCREVNHIVTIGTFFTKGIFEIYKKFDDRYVLLEDAPFFLNLLFDEIEIGFLDEITCIHNKGGVSNSKKKNLLLEEDSLKTLIEIKYPKRKEFDKFTQRVLEFKYCTRVRKNIFRRIEACVLYPDAALYLLHFLIVDWLNRRRFL